MSDATDANGELMASVLGSTYRRQVVESLRADGPATPSQLEERTGVDISHMSRALGDLREVGGVELLVPEDTKKGRLYGLTEAGREAAEVVLDG